MNAFVMKEIGRVGFLDKPVPRPGPGDAIVRTTKVTVFRPGDRVVAGAAGTGTAMERAFEVSDKKLDDVVKVLINFWRGTTHA